jgi:ATP-dependent helicase Lhr and Lhr-like helicase
VGPVTVASVRERYGWDEVWIESRLREWATKGRLVRGRFRPDLEGEQWCPRKLAEVARRRALAALRKQIEAVDVERFAAFLHRWQHVDPRDRLDGPAGVRTALEQLYGIPRPAAAWERDYLPARVNDYDPAWLSEVLASGDIVWAAQPRERTESGNRPLSRVLFFQRGTGSMWLRDVEITDLSEDAVAVRDAIAREGASFFADIQAATGLTTFRVRDALRELVAAGLVTNDTAEALRAVIQWKPVRQEVERDPASGCRPTSLRRLIERPTRGAPTSGGCRSGGGPICPARSDRGGSAAGRSCTECQSWDTSFRRTSTRASLRGSGWTGTVWCSASGGSVSGRRWAGGRSTAS